VYWLGYRLDIQGLDLGRGKSYLFLSTRQTGSVTHWSFYLIGTGFLPGEYNGRGEKLTTDLHPVPRFKIIEVGLYLYTVYMS
jgi:hypothetical protein